MYPHGMSSPILLTQITTCNDINSFSFLFSKSDIQSKIKAVKNVIDMLSKIIKDDESKSAPESVDDSKKKELVSIIRSY